MCWCIWTFHYCKMRGNSRMSKSFFLNKNLNFCLKKIVFIFAENYLKNFLLKKLFWLLFYKNRVDFPLFLWTASKAYDHHRIFIHASRLGQNSVSLNVGASFVYTVRLNVYNCVVKFFYYQLQRKRKVGF